MDKSIIIDLLKEEAERLRTRLDELHVQANLAEKETKQRLEPEIKRLESELGKTKERLNKLLDVSSEVLEESKKGLENAFKEIQQGFEKAFDVLKKSQKN